ncbi:MAG: hypothetical protein V1755_12390 [Chloroflexota bacterium]
MGTLNQFEGCLPAHLRATFRAFRTPADIQRYLDSVPYVGEERDRCPLDVMKDAQCHCLDGGLFAALALRRIGYPGLLIDLVPAHDRKGQKLDDDHVLAIFRRHGAWGAVAKSNYAWLRYREPVFRSLRELVMSYFEVYFSIDGIKTLRGYTRPLDISRYDHLEYAWIESGATELYKALYRRKPISLISKQAAADLLPIDERALASGTVGVDLGWVFRPK